jgi:hypothetical protein
MGHPLAPGTVPGLREEAERRIRLPVLRAVHEQVPEHEVRAGPGRGKQERESVMKDDEKFTYEDLEKADRRMNAGLPMELLSVYGYAQREGISAPEYIIKVLRAERDRQQDIDAVIRDRDMADMFLDKAAEAGMTIVEYVMSGQFFSNPEQHRVKSAYKINPDFLATLLTRMEERAAGQ